MVDGFFVLSKDAQVVFTFLVFRIDLLADYLRALQLGEQLLKMVICLLCLLDETALGHVKLAEDRGSSRVGAVVVHGDVYYEKIAVVYENVIEQICGEQAMSLAHLVLEECVEAVLAPTCVVGVLRVRILFEFWALVFLIQA